MKRSTALKVLSIAGVSAPLAAVVSSPAQKDSNSGKSMDISLDSRARNGNPPVVTVTPWGQHVQHDLSTLIAMQKYMTLKKGAPWSDGDALEKDMRARHDSGALVVEKPPTRLLTGVWALRADGQQRIYLIDTGGGLLLVDPSGDVFTEGVLSQVKELGYARNDIKWVLLTHCHVDHSQSAPYWKSRGMEIIVHEDDLPPLRTANDITAWYLIPKELGGLKPLEGPVRTFGDGDDLKLGGLTLRAVHTPGHTPGSSCFIFSRDNKRVLIGEDIVLHYGRHAWMGNPYADWEQYLASLWKLKRYYIGGEGTATVGTPTPPIEYDLLLPGHGSISLDMAGREIDHTIMLVSEIIRRRRTGDPVDWIDPYPFFREREERGLGPVVPEYR